MRSQAKLLSTGKNKRLSQEFFPSLSEVHKHFDSLFEIHLRAMKFLPIIEHAKLEVGKSSKEEVTSFVEQLKEITSDLEPI